MKNFLIILLSLLLSFGSFSQENCEYAPLQLDDITPIWEHNELHVYGVRTVMDDNAIYGFDFGYEPSHQFHRVYDSDTGELLREQDPITLDENAPIVKSFKGSDYNYFKDDYWEHFNLTVWLDSGSVLTRQLIDTMGYVMGPRRRVVVGDWNEDWDNELITGQLTTNSKLAEGPNNTYAYIQQYIAREEDPRTSKSNVTIFNENFEIVNKLDLAPLLEEGFTGVSIVRYTEQGLILRVNYDISYHHDFLFLDSQLNFIKYDKSLFNDQYVFFRGHNLNYLTDDNQLYMYSPGPIDSTSLSVNFYRTNEENELNYIRRFNITNEGWGAFLTYFTILDNGDYLIKVTYGCFDDGQFGPTYISWMRIDKSEFETMVSISDELNENNSFTLYPNPAESVINIKGDASNIAKINIYDLMGRQIMTTTNLNNIDISNLLSGSYLVSIFNKSGIIEHHKLLKN